MKTMAEVIQSHHMSHADWDERQFAIICHCGTEVTGEDDGEEAYTQEEALYAGHLAGALTAEGFGFIEPFSGIGLANWATRADVARWLRARAASVEGDA